MVLFMSLTGVLIAQDRSWRFENSLLWPQEKRDIAYRNIEKIYDTHTVSAGGSVKRLDAGPPLTLSIDVDAYMRGQYAAGLIVLLHGKVILEKYARGYDAAGRWLSQSMAKSVTSILVGTAIHDGKITSLEDPVIKYLPEMKGSAYDGVTLRQVLTMTSGVKWNEDYTDPNSDVSRYSSQRSEDGVAPIVAYMRKLPREAPPGTKWVYKTGETHLIGMILSRAIGKPLADYLSERIWRPYGMEHDAVWQVSTVGVEWSGCCMAVSLRDYARFGQFVLEGGKAQGKQVVDADYLAAATRKQVSTDRPEGTGYGFQWWTLDDGLFYASGIFGQSIYVDPKRALVMATSGNWPVATDRVKLQPARLEFFRTVQAAVGR